MRKPLVIVLALFGIVVVVRLILGAFVPPEPPQIDGDAAISVCRQFVEERLAPLDVEHPRIDGPQTSVAQIDEITFQVESRVAASDILVLYSCRVRHQDGDTWRLLDLTTN